MFAKGKGLLLNRTLKTRPDEPSVVIFGVHKSDVSLLQLAVVTFITTNPAR